MIGYTGRIRPKGTPVVTQAEERVWEKVSFSVFGRVTKTLNNGE